jgi:hypothetical protein
MIEFVRGALASTQGARGQRSVGAAARRRGATLEEPPQAQRTRHRAASAVQPGEAEPRDRACADDWQATDRSSKTCQAHAAPALLILEVLAMEQVVAVDGARRHARWIQEVLDPQVAEEHLGIKDVQRRPIRELTGERDEDVSSRFGSEISQ